jgi:hypothetical protein
VQVAKVEDANTALAELDALLMSLPDADLGVRLERVDEASDGNSRHDYAWHIDPVRFERIIADSSATARSSQDPQAMAARMEVFLPQLHLAAHDGRLLLCLLNDQEELDSVLQRFTGSGGRGPAALEGLQSWAGSGVQVLSRVELRAVLSEMLQIFPPAEGKNAIAIPAGPPVEIRYAGMVGGTRHSMRLRANTEALMQLMADLESARGGE